MFKKLNKTNLLNLAKALVVVPLIMGANTFAFAQSSTSSPTAVYVPATANSAARIEFRLGGDVEKAELPAWIAQQKAAAPVQNSAPQRVSGLSQRVITQSYFVQAASYTKASTAKSALNKFDDGKVETALVNGTQYYRVLVGPFSSRQTARRGQATVHIAGFTGAFVRG